MSSTSKPRLNFFHLFLVLSTFVFQVAYTADWPVPAFIQMRRTRRYNHYRSLQRHGDGHLDHPHDQSSFNLCRFITDLFSSRVQIVSVDSSTDLVSLGSSGDLTASSDYRKCEICLRAVLNSEFFPCCTNGHSIHAGCFKKIISYESSAALHRCPLCRNPLIVEPARLYDELQRLDYSPEYWAVLDGYFRMFLLLKPREMAELNWPEALFIVLTKGTPAHLRAFLALPRLIDINSTFRNRECAVSVLLICSKLAESKDSHARICENLRIVLEHPQIQLNRNTRRTPRHLIYDAIDIGNLHVFLAILDASPQLDLAAIFRYICLYPRRNQIFFHYFLTSQAFDLFATDEFNTSALHVIVRQGSSEFILLLLKSPQCTAQNLMAADTRNGSTVLHIAMKRCSDEVIAKLISFPGIDWDLTDSSGQSIGNLYENRPTS